jgi:hypothetical protein
MEADKVLVSYRHEKDHDTTRIYQKLSTRLVTGRLLIFSTLLHLPPLNLRDQIVSLFGDLRFGRLKKLLVLIAVRLDQFVRTIRHSRK